jgi:pimeloyl-ACP methyl ester carboxylesterase
MKLFIATISLVLVSKFCVAQTNSTDTAMSKIQSKTIVFITGAYVSHHCWDEWVKYFESLGYKTIAPPWPGKDAEPATLRARHPDSALAAVTLPALIAYHEDLVKKLPEKPIIIGHSFGGMIAQVLLNRGLAAAAVAIHAVPPSNIMPYEWQFLKSNLKTLGYFTSVNKTYMMSFEKWQYAFTNGMDLAEQKASYEKITIPESKRVARGGLTNASKIDFSKEHEPLLILAGTKDQCIPEHLCRRNYKKYKSKKSITEYIVKDRNHYVLGLPTWEEDAAFIQKWLATH